MQIDGWREISDFPGYAVSLAGDVQNLRTGRVMSLLKNRQNVIYVGLIRDGRQYQRSVTVLVAHAFLNPPPRSDFNTPICLDGDRTNNHYRNLRWRPRGFAVSYHNQFKTNSTAYRYLYPIEDVDTGDEYENSWPAAITYGLLESHVYIGIMNQTVVWPEDKRFRRIKKRFDYEGNVIPHLLRKTY